MKAANWWFTKSLEEKMRLQFLAATILVFSTLSAQADPFGVCVDGLRTAAHNAGVSKAITDEALNVPAPVERVTRLSKVQPEFKTPIWDYLGFLVDDQRIADGQAMMAEHGETLAAAEKRYGVDRYVIAAVWGVESNFGRQAGKNFLPHALATLTCTNAGRKSFWRGQLLAALKLVQRGDLQLEKLYGSWAGAFGQTQFIPTTYEALAVDFDGDGRRDLIDSVPDALGSTANYLKDGGWRTGQPWLIEAKLPDGYNGPSGRTKKASLSSWAAKGINPRGWEADFRQRCRGIASARWT